MIYLILTFISLSILFFMLYVMLNIAVSSFYARQNFYGSINTKRNVFLFYLIKFLNKFSYILKIIKLKIFVDYTDKLDKILKILDFDDIQINSYTFVFIQILSMFVGCFVAVFIFGFDILFMFCFGILFLILPYLKIYEQYNKKINEIVKQIPDVSSLLAVMLSSGIDFNGSLNKIITILDGSLITELKNTINKISLGVNIKTAFEEMAEKYNIIQLDTFVKTITMSLETGAGFADSLNKISKQISDDNVAIAEKKAHEAPVKMLLPMTILILPTIFILLFAPFVISFFKSGTLF
ncbi:MAG: type II secretion system F family protein [Elusimicrobia bacterium]|nr:type II secretion system F family protein [Elusimicrobiota bacterium]